MFAPGSNRTYLVTPESLCEICYYYKNTALTQFDDVGLLWLPGNEEQLFADWDGSSLKFDDVQEFNLVNLLYLSIEKPELEENK